MSFQVGSTTETIAGPSNPEKPITGNIEQPQQNDKCAGSKMASVVKGISAYCDGVSVQLAPPNLGNPAASDSGKAESKDDDEKAEEKSSGGAKMTVKPEEQDVEEKEKLKEFSKKDPEQAYKVACEKGWYDVAGEIKDMMTESKTEAAKPAEKASEEASGADNVSKDAPVGTSGSQPEGTMPQEA